MNIPQFSVGALVTRPKSSFPQTLFKIVRVTSGDSQGKAVYVIDFARGKPSADGRGFLAWEDDISLIPPCETR
jgi:hypothetical protein